MHNLKLTSALFFLVFQTSFAQSGISVLIHLPDTQIIQAVHVQPNTDGLWLCGSALSSSPTTGELDNSIQIFSLNNLFTPIAKTDILSSAGALLPQLFAQNPLGFSDNKLILAYQLKDDDFYSYSSLKQFGTDGIETWGNFKKLSGGFSGDVVVVDEAQSRIHQFGLTSPVSFSGFWPAIIYNFTFGGTYVDSTVFKLPQSSEDFEYNSILKAAKMGSNFVVLSSWFEFEGNGISTGTTLSLIGNTGNVIWTKQFLAPDEPTSFVIDEVQQTIIAIFDQTDQVGNFSICLRKYDDAGALISEKCHVETSTSLPFSASIGACYLRSDNSLFLTCLKYYGSKSIASVMKFNLAGEKEWERVFVEGSLPSSFIGYFTSITASPNGDILAAGGLGDPANASQWDTRQYYWLIGLTENGCFGTDCSDTVRLNSITLATSPDNGKIEKQNVLEIFPNPVNSDNALFVKLPELLAKDIHVAVIGLQGNTFPVSSEIIDNYCKINTTTLPPGQYFLKIFSTNSGEFSASKFFKFK